MAGAIALATGVAMLGGATIQTLSGPAFADSVPYETYCPGTPLGAVVLNDVVVTGALSPTSPSVGEHFTLTGFQTQEQLPAAIAQSAEATGLTSLTGSLTTTIDATGATPASLSTGTVKFTIPLPNPVPPTGVTVSIPSVTVGPFTATSPNIALSAAPESQTMDIDGDGIGLISLHCTDYTNDSLPSGFTNDLPPGLPVSPLIATAGQVTTPPPSPLTGAYELYCPHTPVGDLVFNDVTTSATISPATLSAGDQFHVTGYQTDIPIPPGAVTAAVGLGNGGFDGLAASYVDAYGTTSSQAPTGSMGFSVPIPNPVPSTALPLDVPSSAISVGPLTAMGGPITIAQDQSILVVAELSSKAFTMSCTAYPNDSIARSGSTDEPPTGSPIRPVIATGNASGTPITTTTTSTGPGGTGPISQNPGPYELYCPHTPVGDIAINDVVTTGSISPSSLNEGDSFQISSLQTKFTIPQAVAQEAENLGLSTLSGNLSLFLGVKGAQGGGIYPIASGGSGSGSIVSTGGSITAQTPGGEVVVIPAYKYPGQQELSFSVTLPTPVPPTGVQFTATPTAGSQPNTFVATGGPISVFMTGANLNVQAFGDRFGLFCGTLANGTVPTGLSIRRPTTGYVVPLVTTGTATVIPPPPAPPGAYELYCPGTPVGNLVMNDATSSASLSPPDPSAGQQFQVTDYQAQLTLPADIVSAAAALGNTSITGSATTTLDAVGATPASLQPPTLSFDVPIPNPVPSSGVVLSTTPVAAGPFTSTGGTVSISQKPSISLTVSATGSDTAPPASFACTSYRNDSTLPSGTTLLQPSGQAVSPVLVPSEPALTVLPSSVVSNGESVTVSGAGFQADSLGAVLECNTAAGEPTVALGSPVNASVPVGCTAPNYNQVIGTSSAGTVSTTYTVTTGTVGPPCGASNDVISVCPSADSAGQDPTADAAAYPCPPTETQQEAGATCVVMYGDENGDSASVPISFPGTRPPQTTTTVGPVTTSAGSSTASAEITQAYQTLFDFTDPSVADKVAVIQNGASLQDALSQALSSALAASATGAKVDAISFLSATSCTQENLPSPCAQVTYDILGHGGTALLPNNQGYAVSVDGTWLVATNTVCVLLDLFYQAEGKSGTPPGCPSAVSSTPTTTISGSTDTGAGPTDTSTMPTSAASPTSVMPTSTAGSPTTDATTTPTTVGAVANTNTGSPGSGAPDPVVEAGSGSLAFTGLGEVSECLVVGGGSLVLLGLVLLVLVDTPRRLTYRLAHLGWTPTQHQPTKSDDAESPTSVNATETLWIQRCPSDQGDPLSE